MKTFLKRSVWGHAILILFATNQTLVIANNLVVNGDFEKTNGDNVAEWVISVSGLTNTVSSAEKNPENVHDGKVSLHLKTDKTDEASSKKMLMLNTRKLENVVPGTEYKLTFYAKAAEDKQLLSAYYYTNSRVKPHYYKKKDFKLTTSWAQYEFVLKLPDEKEWNNREMNLRMDLPGGSEVFLDDVVLEPSTETPGSTPAKEEKAKDKAPETEAKSSAKSPPAPAPKEAGDPGKIAGIDAAKNTVFVVFDGSKDKTGISLTPTTTITVDGKPARLQDLKEKMSVLIVPDADPLYAVAIKAKSH